MLAKQRWRRFSGRPPRRCRRGHFNKYHQKNNYGKTYASFLPPNAFAAHGGPGGKSKGKCGSTEHLIRKCPQADASGQSHAVSMLSRPLADVTGTNASVPSNLQFYARGLPLSSEVLQSVGSGVPSSGASSVKRSGSVIDDLESIGSIVSSKRRAENPRAEVQSETASPARPMRPPPTEQAPSAQDLAVTSSPASAMMWTSGRTGLLSNVGSETGSSVGRSSSDVSNVLAGISFRTSSATHGSGVDSVEGTSSSSKSRRKTGAHDERRQRIQESTTLQLSELLSGMGRMSQAFPVPFAATSNRSLTNVSSQASEPKATDARSEPSDANANNAEYHPWWETVEPSAASATHVNNFHSYRTCNSSGLVG